MERKMFTVRGKLSLPLEFSVKAESQQAANEYAESIFNSRTIRKLEADLYDDKNKCHFLNATKCTFNWKQ